MSPRQQGEADRVRPAAGGAFWTGLNAANSAPCVRDVRLMKANPSGGQVGPLLLGRQSGFLDEIQRPIDLHRAHARGFPVHEDRTDHAAPSVVLADFVAKLA